MEVRVDRVKMMYRDMTKEHFLAALDALKAMPVELKGKAKATFSKKEYVTQGAIHLGEGATLHISTGMNRKKYYLTESFNPSKMGVQARKLFNDLQLLLIEPYKGYEDLYAEGFLTYLEIAVDVPNEVHGNLIFVDDRSHGVNDKLLGKGSLYIGSASSSRSWIIYDKAAQLAATSGIKLDYPLLRIEARLHPKDMHADEVASHASPFPHLFISRREDLASISGLGAGWEEFWERAVLGDELPHAVYRELSAAKRKSVLKVLRENPAPFWKTAQIWQDAIKASAILKP